MNKIQILILYSSVLFFYGCTSTMVVKPGKVSPSKYAPINESSRRGIIKYLNQGASPVITQRREDAYKKMYEACGGKYRIIAEGPRMEDGVILPAGNTMMYAQQQYVYIEFECIHSLPNTNNE